VKAGTSAIVVQTVFLVSVLGGVVSLVAAVGIARTHWRTDVARFSSETNALNVLLRPASYVASGLGAIRTLTLLGCGLLGVALLCLVYELLVSLAVVQR
jgi:hypothetical protein